MVAVDQVLAQISYCCSGTRLTPPFQTTGWLRQGSSHYSNKILMYLKKKLEEKKIVAYRTWRVFRLGMLLKLDVCHIRRIELENKAKVVATDWGTESLPH